MQTHRAINPHLGEAECREAEAKEHVVGCCRPYRIRRLKSGFVVESCGYI